VALLWRRNAAEQPQQQRAADAVADRETEREYLRLLYVAMTRARDALYVAGVKGERTPKECWYSLIEKALVPADTRRDPETGELAEAYRWPQPPRAAVDREDKPPESEGVAPPAPDWLHRAAPSPGPAPEPLRPSFALAEPDPPAEAPRELAVVAAARDAAADRGRVVHRLLQVLPGLPEPARTAAAERILSRELPDEPAIAARIRDEVRSLIALPALAAAFAPESRAEVAIVGRVATERGEYAVSGRIDRLVRDASGWLLLDFKTTRAVPGSPEDVDPAAILQLALYRRLLMEMDQGADARATLVYTAGPNVMPIPSELMERELQKLGIR
jgi:ATP-dependent helicase/nuclease subunit A